MKAEVYIRANEERGIWQVIADGGTISPIYQKEVAEELVTEVSRILNAPRECELRQAAHDAWEEEKRLAAIEREKERQRQREERERREEERQEKLRERILRAMMLSDIDPMDFDAIVYAHDGKHGYGRSRDWRLAVYADERLELLDEDDRSTRWNGTAKGKAIADAKEEHEERVISIAQDFESARFERRGSKPDREYEIKWQVYENGATRYRRNSNTKGRLRYMYLEGVIGNHGYNKKKGDIAYALGRARDGVGPARFDTEQEAIEWRDQHDEYGIVASIKIPIKKGATR